MDLLPSDGRQGDGNARPGSLSSGKRKEVGSLKDILAVWEKRLPGTKVLPISALEGINTNKASEQVARKRCQRNILNSLLLRTCCRTKYATLAIEDVVFIYSVRQSMF